jgi:hypothetical protein
MSSGLLVAGLFFSPVMIVAYVAAHAGDIGGETVVTVGPNR